MSSGLVNREVAAMMGVIDTYSRYKGVNGRPRNYKVYHPSALGKCLRLMQYQRFSEDGIAGLSLSKEPFESKTMRIFDTGHSMHDRWVDYWAEVGVLRGVWQCKNPLCRAFDDEGEFLGTDKVNEINELRVTMSKETPVEAYEIGADPEKGRARASLLPRKYGKENKIGIFQPKACKCGCCEFDYHEVNVVDEDLNLFGHADQILDFSNFDVDQYSKDDGSHVAVDRTFDPRDLPKTPIVADMKTINDRRYGSLIKNGPGLDYKVQLKVYCNILDVDYGVLIYENKNTSETASFKVERSSEVDWPIVKRQIKQMNKMYDKKKLPPPRPTRKDSYDCKYCDYKDICHNSKVWSDPELSQKRINFYGRLLEG